MKYLIGANIEEHHVSYHVLPFEDAKSTFWQKNSDAVVYFDSDKEVINAPVSYHTGYPRVNITVNLLDNDGNPDFAQERILSLPMSAAKKISEMLKRASEEKNENLN
jgi:hypothetical protein